MVNMVVTKAFTSGVPTLVNQHGAVKIYEMPLSAEEQALLR